VPLREWEQGFEGLIDKKKVAVRDRDKVLLRQFDQLRSNHYETSLEAYETFLPPRLVSAVKARTCVVFFGAGVSASAGIPGWWTLLERLGLPPDMADEPDLDNDPLTAAEVVAHQIGLPKLQGSLVESIKGVHEPGLPHFLLARLDQAVYVTTNYDCLFETAWEELYPDTTPIVVTTNTDLAELPGDYLASDRPVLFKLHGSTARDYEELILTRSQYRRHYRTNIEMFEKVAGLLGRSKTLFLGFGHRDPEITRLIEDVIHEYERSGRTSEDPPSFYSLQFDMRERTPEIFAARGIVALKPPIQVAELPAGVEPRTLALTRSTIDLLGAAEASGHPHNTLDLDEELGSALEALEQDVSSALDRLAEVAAEYAAAATLEDVDGSRADACGVQLGTMAGQGLYVLSPRNRVVHAWLPDELTMPDRRPETFSEQRPYIRQARMYRDTFASTVVESKFNGNATVFLCAPIIAGKNDYEGLVFAAAQPGAWDLPLHLRTEVVARHGEKVSFILVDSDGVVLMPPNDELPVAGAHASGEPLAANRGFAYTRLLRLSRRDKLVERVWNNIVPLGQDDDTIRLGDVRMYSVVAEVRRTRWKLALSIPYLDEQ
jgi:hypothetical protein